MEVQGTGDYRSEIHRVTDRHSKTCDSGFECDREGNPWEDLDATFGASLTIEHHCKTHTAG